MSRIEKIEAYEVTIPLPKPLVLGAIVIPHREYVIVRIHDSDGNIGTSYGLTRNAPMSQMILQTVAPFWQHQPLAQHAQFYEHAAKANVCLGTNGVFWRALSLCDCALYDLLAKRDNLPLSQYLGGTPKPVPTVLVWGYPLPDETPQSLAHQMEVMAAYQPAGVKIASSSDDAKDTQRLATCRAALSDNIPLMIDLHWRIRDPQAFFETAQQWADFNMGWIEDPVPFDDFDGLRFLSEKLAYPVSMGDEQSGVRHFQRIIEQGGVNILRLDATVCGGVRAFQQICEIAARNHIPIATHIFHHLHAQLAGAIPNVQWIEYMLPESDIECIFEVWEDDLTWSGNGLQGSDRPGIGIRWDEDKLAFYRNP